MGSDAQQITASSLRRALGRKRGKDGTFSHKGQSDYSGAIPPGTMFGHWRVVSGEILLHGRYRYLLCDDGFAREEVALDNLLAGKSRHSRKYPRTGIPDYGRLRHLWEAMMARCYNPANPNYARYGGRGIRVAEEWHDPRRYARAVSTLPLPEGRPSLDRIDNDGNYEPGNVRWITAADQNRNKKGNNNVQFLGKTMCLVDFSNYCMVGMAYARRALELGHEAECVAAMEPGVKSGGSHIRHCRCRTAPSVLGHGVVRDTPRP